MNLIITKCFPACLSPHHPILERLHFESMGVNDILFHWHNANLEYSQPGAGPCYRMFVTCLCHELLD